VSATAPVVEFDQVVKDYPTGLLRKKPLRAVAGVSFRVEPGEVFGLLGPNRAARPLLVKLLLSLCRPPPVAWRAWAGRPPTAPTLAAPGYVHENQAFPATCPPPPCSSITAP